MLSSGLMISEDADDPATVVEDDDGFSGVASLVPIGSTDIFNFEAVWAFCAFGFPFLVSFLFSGLRARCTWPAIEAQI